MVPWAAPTDSMENACDRWHSAYVTREREFVFLLQSFAGLCGALLFGVGVLGAGLASLFVDRTRKFEEVAKISFALAALCCVGFMVVGGTLYC